MSLANAQSEISAHPGKNSVTHATDKAAQAADVDRKMRFYGAIEAFRNGKLPDNNQIDETLRYLEAHDFINLQQLSPDGRKLISDSRDIIETARLMVQQKNADELFQNFAWHTSGTDFNKAKVNTDAAAPIGKDDVKNDGQTAVQHLRTLMSLILTNSEARKLLSDGAVIGRDLFARGAVKAADNIRPSDDQLRNVDDAAPPGQFEDMSTTVGGNKAVYDPKTGTTIVTYPDGTTHTADRAAGNVAGDAKQVAADHARVTADAMSGDTNPDGSRMGKRDRLRAGFNSLTDRIPDEHKQRATDQYNQTKDFLGDEFPQERRDQYIYRLKKVLVECQQHQDYVVAMTWFLDTFETYMSHGKNMATHSAGQASEVTGDQSLQQASTELRVLLERFANGRSMSGVENAVRALYDDAQHDEGLRNWFGEFDQFLRQTLLEPGYVLSPQCTNHWNRLQDSGQGFFDNKYKGHKDNLFNEIGTWFGGFAEDPLNSRFSSDWKRLTKDLLFDSDGNLTFKPHLWDDIRRVILPAMIENVGYVPIPRIEYTDKMLDLVIENLTLQGQNMFPNIIAMEAHNFMQFSPYNNIPDNNHHNFTFTLSQIQADMRDVAFFFHKKSGFPKLSDSGLADVFLGGEGMTVTIQLASAGKDRSSVFHVKHVNVKFDSLKFSVRDSKHDLLYKTIAPLATGLVKKQIAKAITDTITTGLEYVDEQLVQVRDRMAEAQGNDEVSRVDVVRNMFERKQNEAQQKKASTDAQFKIVAKRDSVLIPNAGHESGWINKQAEREAAANEGTTWHSKAFSIINPIQASSPQATTHVDASRTQGMSR